MLIIMGNWKLHHRYYSKLIYYNNIIINDCSGHAHKNYSLQTIVLCARRASLYHSYTNKSNSLILQDRIHHGW